MKDKSVTIVKVGPDPFGRGERTVFYRDSSVNDGKDIFYLWACHWSQSYPHIPIPKDDYDIEPPLPPNRKPCVPSIFRRK